MGNQFPLVVGVDEGVIHGKGRQIPVKSIFRRPDMGPQSARTRDQGKIAVVSKQAVTDMVDGRSALLMKLLLQAFFDHLLLHEVDRSAKAKQWQQNGHEYQQGQFG